MGKSMNTVCIVCFYSEKRFLHCSGRFISLMFLSVPPMNTYWSRPIFLSNLCFFQLPIKFCLSSTGISVRRARERAGTHPTRPTRSRSRSIYRARKTLNFIVGKRNEESPKSNYDSEFDAFDEELDSN